MKIILQLLVAAVVLNACFQGGRAALRHYEFKDAVEQEVRFGEKATVPELQSRLVELAGEHGVALDAADVHIERRGQETRVALSYVEDIEYVPRAYTRPKTFEVAVNATAMHLK